MTAEKELSVKESGGVRKVVAKCKKEGYVL